MSGYTSTPKILNEIYRVQEELPDLDAHERLILRMCANLLEVYHRVPAPQNRLTDEEYFAVPQRWELVEGMLREYGVTAPVRLHSARRLRENLPPFDRAAARCRNGM